MPSLVRFARLSAAFFVLTSAFALAQYRAGIQGTVLDTSGAAIAGANVTVTNQETNLTRSTTSGETGFYRVSSLPPGRYTVTVTADGFQRSQIKDFAVDAERIRGFDVTMNPGQVQQDVTVTAEAAALQTENAEVAGTISTVEVQRVPQVGRDPYELVRLTPGVFGLGARDAAGGSVGLPNQAGPGGSSSSIFQTENQVPVTANGQRVEANGFQIDGVNANSQAWGGAAVVTPNQESVKEIRVVANPYSAEYGRNSGAQIQVVSQNGTNDFHGSLVFKRNTPGLNAFNKWGGAGRDPERVNQLRSQYAGSVGGPILRDRLFFFFSYETQRQRSEGAPETFMVETPEFVSAVQAQRSGTKAAQILAFPGMTPTRAIGINSTRTCAVFGARPCAPVGTGFDIGSFTGGVGQLVATPEGGGLDGIPDVQFVNVLLPSRNKSEQYNARVDYQVTQNDLLAFSMYFVPVENTFADWGNSGRPGLDFTSSRRNIVGTALYTRTLSPTTVNEARFNVTRWYFDEVESNPDIGWGIPRIEMCFGECMRLANFAGPGVFYQTTYNFRDTLTKVVNSHSLKFGGDVIREQNNDRAPWAGRARYNFDNLWSFANDAPSQQTAFFDPSTGAFTELRAYARTNYYSVFGQDDWKLRPNLTVNLGLRWEYFSPLRSANDRISNLILGEGGSLTDARLQVGGELFEPDRNNLAPQVGFAWSPTRFENKAVIRGGFGLGYNRLPGSRLFESRFNAPFFTEFALSGAQVQYAFSSDPNSFDYPPNPNATLTFDPTSGLPLIGPTPNMNATAQNLPNPYTYRYSLETEYDLGNNWVAALGYQGSSSRKLPRVLPYHLFVTPHPRLGAVRLLVTDVNSNYNALLARVTRTFTRGLLMNAQYRWSKSMDHCSNDHNCQQTYPFDQSFEWGPSDFDVTHNLQLWGSYVLPFLRDRDDVLGKVVGGWEISGVITASSGFPWTPVYAGGAGCPATVAAGGLCPLRPVAYAGGAGTDYSDEAFMQSFGNFPGGPNQYFEPPATGVFAVPPPPGIGRNSFRGPNYFSTDMALFKRFGLPSIPVLGENAGIEFRAQAFNIFNNLNLRPFRFNEPESRIGDINADGTVTENTQFGRADRGLAGRVIEFQARFSF